MTAKANQRPHIIVFSLGGLNTLWLGCYGNTSVSTPGLDRLALRSLVFDQYYTNSSRSELLYSSFLHGIHPGHITGTTDEFSSLPGQLSRQGYRTVLLTDDDVAATGDSGKYFDEIVEMNQEDIALSVDSYDQTRFCQYFEETIRILSERMEIDSDDAPIFLWCRFKGFFGPWDFPEEDRLAEREDEEDPEPYAGTEVPFWEEKTDLNVHDDSRFRPEMIRDHDAILSYLQTWKAGLAVLDTAMENFLDFLGETGLDRNAVFVFTSERGFPLGEHGRVGYPTVADGIGATESFQSNQSRKVVSNLLYPEEFHCPLMICLPGFDELAFRTSLLCGPTDLYSMLKYIGLKEHAEQKENTPFLPAVLEEKESFHHHLLFVENDGDSVNRCVVTEQWLFRQTSFTCESGKEPDGWYRGIPVYYEVYTFPDDRFCVNDVSSRTAQTHQELVALLDKF